MASPIADGPGPSRRMRASTLHPTARLHRAVLGSIALLLAGCMDANMSDFPPPSATLPVTTSPPPGRLVARFFGVTTIHLARDSQSILFDGFFSRPGLVRTALGHIAPDDERIAAALRHGGITGVSALFVAHSHYDHALDSARVARHTGALLLGSASTGVLAHAEGLAPDRFRRIDGGQTHAFDPFSVTIFRVPHGPPVLFQGEIDRPFPRPAHVSDYREGGNFSFLVHAGPCAVLVHSSAGVSPDLAHVRADIVFLGIGALGRQDDSSIEHYWRATVEATQARLAILTHWDDFFRPLKKGLRPMPPPVDRVDHSLEKLQSLSRRLGSTAKIAFMPLYAAVDLEQVAGPCRWGRIR